MKKIVALVLSLVMVLGLATTAFAAENTTYKQIGTDYYKMDSVDNDNTDAKTVWLAKVAASSPKDEKDAVTGVKDGKITGAEVGNIEYFLINDGTNDFTASAKYVQVGALADADYVLYYHDATGAATTNVFMYLADLEVAHTYAGTAVPFTAFGDDCGEFDYDPEDDVDYVTFQGGVYEIVEDSTAATSLKYNGELVSVNELSATNWVGHVPAFTYDEDYEAVAVKCAECGVAGVIVENYKSLPKAILALGEGVGFFPVNGTEYYYWTAAPAADAETETDKVESAQTFDAGIAMYVGMSVMAAAGSAVVLKKKD